jgi:hypothetical protein
MDRVRSSSSGSSGSDAPRACSGPSCAPASKAKERSERQDASRNRKARSSGPVALHHLHDEADLGRQPAASRLEMTSRCPP